MKKILILPSSTGQGDLAVASALGVALSGEFKLATAYFEQNKNSPLLQEIPGEHVLFSPGSHPDHSAGYEVQIRCLASEITSHEPDVVVALNEATFALAGFLASRPVIQLTHLIDRGIVTSSSWMLRKALNCSVALPGNLRDLPQALRKDPSALRGLLARFCKLQSASPLVRAVRKLRRTVSPMPRTRVRMELVHRYGSAVATTYLSQLLCDELIVHSIFRPQRDAVELLNSHRRSMGNRPLLFADSIPSQEHVAERKGPKVILLTFGGIDHELSSGMERLLRILNSATAQISPGKLKIQLAGRVTETKRAYFESRLSPNQLFQAGEIEILGSIDHQRHLQLLENADLVITQPGYSTLCEMTSAKKPFLLFYGLAPYYEQYVNFVNAHKEGLCLNCNREPWLQIGEFGQFGSRRNPREPELIANLTLVLDQLSQSTVARAAHPQSISDHFTTAVAAGARALSFNSPANLKIAV